MKTTMSSRARMLCAIQGGMPDHVPLWNLWRTSDIPFHYDNQVERAEGVLALGLDDTLLLEPPLNKSEHYDVNQVPHLDISVHREADEESPYPLLIKDYDTSDGRIRQVVRRTEDWPYGHDVRLFSDFNVSRSVEFPVKGPEDLPRLRHLLTAHTPEQIATFRERATALRRESQRLDVVLEGGWTVLGDAALWLLGTERLLLSQMDQPAFVEELLEIVCQWEMARISLLLNAGVDVIVHSAWYESTDFWTPTNYHQMLKPRLKRMIDLVHDAGAHFSYICTTSWQPLTDDLIDLQIDSLMGVDPVQGRADLAKTRRDLGEYMCLWGGLNGALTLGEGSTEEICQATQAAIRTLGPDGGFVLYPVDQLVAGTPWKNVRAMIDCWREVGSYPIG